MSSVTYTSTQGVKLIGTEVGAWLADNTAGTVGCSLDQVTNKVTNGDFTTDLSSWDVTTGWSQSAGKAVCDGVTDQPRLAQNGIILINRTYKVTFTISGYTAGSCYLVLGGAQPAGNLLTANQAYEFIVTATSSGDLSFTTPSGTYDGQIDDIVVTEYCAPNLLSHSENFGNTIWPKLNANIISNDVINFDGSLSADKMNADGSGNHYIIRAMTVNISTHTLSVHAKKGGVRYLRMYLNNVTDSSRSLTIYDLQTGSVVSGPGAIEEKAGGWYRLSLTATCTITSEEIIIWLLDDSLNTSFLADESSYLYLSSAQLTETAELQGYGSSHDISANDHALQVKGELTKTPVATGSGLQAWSGFSAKDYLEQPYDAAYNLGTAAFHIRGWAKITPNTTKNTLFERDSATTAQRITITCETDGTIDYTLDDNTTVRTASTTTTYDDSVWHHYIFIYDGAGGLFIFIDTVQQATTTGTALLTMNNAAAVVRLGLDVQDANPASDSEMLIWTLGTGDLTAAQKKSIYDQEKQLFRPYTAMQIEGQDYSLDLSVSQLDSSTDIESKPVKSLGGNQETTFIRRDTYHNFTVVNRQRATLPEIKAFFDSVEKGETFTFDPYGSIALPDDPVSVIADPGFKPSRNGTNDEFTVNMRVREV